MACVSCGREVPLEKLPSHLGNLGACAPCISKHGAVKLANEADRLLAEYFFFEKPAPHCLCCGAPLIMEPSGWRPMWCQNCEVERKAYVAKLARS